MDQTSEPQILARGLQPLMVENLADTDSEFKSIPYGRTGKKELPKVI